MEKLSKPSLILDEEAGLGLPKRPTAGDTENKPVPIAAVWIKDRLLEEGSNCFMFNLEFALIIIK